MDCNLFSNGFCYYKQNCRYNHNTKKISVKKQQNENNLLDENKLKINRFNLQYFPIFIQKKIKIFIISQYEHIFKYLDYQDICEILIQELYNLYKKYIQNYRNPYILSFCKAECIVCKKNIINECYSQMIDFNYGWNYCIDCQEYINIWSQYHSEKNNIFPISNIDNFDSFDKIFFYRSTKNRLQEGYINDFSKHLYLDKMDNNIYILVFWDTKNKTVEKWILLKNLVDNNTLFSNIKFKCPPYWSQNKFNFWNDKLKQIKKIFN